MPRRTREELDHKARRILFMGVPIVIEYSGVPQRPRAYLRTSEGGYKDLSPRCTVTELYDWLEAFEIGLVIGEELTRKKVMGDIHEVFEESQGGN